MTEKIINTMGLLILAIATLGWIDWLWIFGIENSKSYTWWQLIYSFGQ